MAVSAPNRVSPMAGSATDVGDRRPDLAGRPGVALIWSAPFIWMVSTSFKHPADVMTQDIEWMPRRVTFASYVRIFAEYPVLQWGLNSVIQATVAHGLSASCSAPWRAMRWRGSDFPGRDALFAIFLASLMIPAEISVIPLLLGFIKLGLGRRYEALIAADDRQRFQRLHIPPILPAFPDDIEEAAQVDGAGPFRLIFWRIALPLARAPAIAATVILFTLNWNNFLWPLLVTFDDSMKTLPVGIAAFTPEIGTHTQLEGFTIGMAGVTILACPACSCFSPSSATSSRASRRAAKPRLSFPRKDRSMRHTDLHRRRLACSLRGVPCERSTRATEGRRPRSPAGARAGRRSRRARRRGGHARAMAEADAGRKRTASVPARRSRHERARGARRGSRPRTSASRSQARGDIDGVVATFRYNAGAADKMEGDDDSARPRRHRLHLLEPLGVTAHIVPWNYPLGMAIRSLAPALAAGCTAVLKPAEQSPLSALSCARTLREAGFPKGVVNVVTGFGEEAGECAGRHPGRPRHHLHRLGRDRPQDPRRRRAGHQARGAGAGRQEPDDRLRRRQPRPSRGRCARRVLRELRPGLLLRLALSSAPRDARRIPRPPDREGEEADGRARRGDLDLGPLVSARAIRPGDRLYRGRAFPPAPGCAWADIGREISSAAISSSRRSSTGSTRGRRSPAKRFSAPSASRSTFDRRGRSRSRSPTASATALSPASTRSDILARPAVGAGRLEAGSVWINGWWIGGLQAPTGGVKDSGIGRERGLPGIMNYLQMKNVGIRICIRERHILSTRKGDQER